MARAAHSPGQGHERLAAPGHRAPAKKSGQTPTELRPTSRPPCSRLPAAGGARACPTTTSRRQTGKLGTLPWAMLGSGTPPVLPAAQGADRPHRLGGRAPRPAHPAPPPLPGPGRDPGGEERGGPCRGHGCGVAPHHCSVTPAGPCQEWKNPERHPTQRRTSAPLQAGRACQALLHSRWHVDGCVGRALCGGGRGPRTGSEGGRLAGRWGEGGGLTSVLHPQAPPCVALESFPAPALPSQRSICRTTASPAHPQMASPGQLPGDPPRT